MKSVKHCFISILLHYTEHKNTFVLLLFLEHHYIMRTKTKSKQEKHTMTHEDKYLLKTLGIDEYDWDFIQRNGKIKPGLLSSIERLLKEFEILASPTSHTEAVYRIASVRLNFNDIIRHYQVNLDSFQQSKSRIWKIATSKAILFRDSHPLVYSNINEVNDIALEEVSGAAKLYRDLYVSRIAEIDLLCQKNKLLQEKIDKLQNLVSFK